MPYQLITDRHTWDTALAQLPQPQTLQSWDWGDFKSRWGWQPLRLLWRVADRPIAAAQLLRRAIPKTPWGMLYAPRGPLLDYGDTALLPQVLQDLADFGRKQKAIFLKIDPAVALAGEPDAMEVYPQGAAVKSILQAQGWRLAPQQIQFKNTVLLDLTPSEADLLTAMKSKWRYNIRLAEKRGVSIEAGTAADLTRFYEMYALTAQRDGFLIRPQAYYLDVWQQYLHTDRAALLLAQVDGETVAGLILFFFAQTAWYMYGASTNQQRQLMPNHLLQWEAIRVAKAKGCTLYDMWGAPDHFTEADSMWGVYRFKLGFNGYTQQGLGAYDLPLHPLKYQLYNYALPKLLASLKKFV